MPFLLVTRIDDCKHILSFNLRTALFVFWRLSKRSPLNKECLESIITVLNISGKTCIIKKKNGYLDTCYGNCMEPSGECTRVVYVFVIFWASRSWKLSTCFESETLTRFERDSIKVRPDYSQRDLETFTKTNTSHEFRFRTLVERFL